MENEKIMPELQIPAATPTAEMFVKAMQNGGGGAGVRASGNSMPVYNGGVSGDVIRAEKASSTAAQALIEKEREAMRREAELRAQKQANAEAAAALILRDQQLKDADEERKKAIARQEQSLLDAESRLSRYRENLRAYDDMMLESLDAIKKIQAQPALVQFAMSPFNSAIYERFNTASAMRNATQAQITSLGQNVDNLVRMRLYAEAPTEIDKERESLVAKNVQLEIEKSRIDTELQTLSADKKSLKSIFDAHNSIFSDKYTVDAARREEAWRKWQSLSRKQDFAAFLGGLDDGHRMLVMTRMQQMLGVDSQDAAVEILRTLPPKDSAEIVFAALGGRFQNLEQAVTLLSRANLDNIPRDSIWGNLARVVQQANAEANKDTSLTKEMKEAKLKGEINSMITKLYATVNTSDKDVIKAYPELAGVDGSDTNTVMRRLVAASPSREAFVMRASKLLADRKRVVDSSVPISVLGISPPSSTKILLQVPGYLWGTNDKSFNLSSQNDLRKYYDEVKE